MRKWQTYFTPKRLADDLIDRIYVSTPRHIGDICAGSGNLLTAAASRWPAARLWGNDLYRSAPTHLELAWSRRDGRLHAQSLREQGKSFDLIVGNPPFGQFRRPSRVSSDVPSDVGKLLTHPRIEIGMTAASALLVRRSGVLATLVPDSVVAGPVAKALREWMGTMFHWFDVIPLHRQRFGRRDLGVTLIVAYRTAQQPPGSSVIDAHAFANGPKGPGRSWQLSPLPVTITRGSLSTADLSARGSVSILHCGSDRLRSSYCERRTTISAARRARQWANAGDVLICRVGKGAGMASIYRGPRPTPITDCLFVVRAGNHLNHRRLQEVTRNGTLARLMRDSTHGLGARFVTREAVLSAIEHAAFRQGS
jgi:hypothetical protein